MTDGTTRDGLSRPRIRVMLPPTMSLSTVPDGILFNNPNVPFPTVPDGVLFNDPNTDAYFEVWRSAVERAQGVYDADVQTIRDAAETMDAWRGNDPTVMREMWNPRGRGLLHMQGAPAFRLLGRFLSGVEDAIEKHMRKYTSDVWLFQSRRHLACQLLFVEKEDVSEVILEGLIRQKIAAAISVFAAPGNTMLPKVPGRYPALVTDELVVDIEVVFRLCRLHQAVCVERRRSLTGGVPTVGVGPHLTIFLPAHVEARIDRQSQRRSGGGPFSRMGLHVAGATLQDWVESYGLCFCVAVRQILTEPQALERAAEVRPFRMYWYHARPILDALEMFSSAVFTRWGLTPLEIVSAAVALCQRFRDAMMEGFDDGASDAAFQDSISDTYCAEARAVFSIDEADVATVLAREIPGIAKRLGGAVRLEEVPRVVRTFLTTFASHPGEAKKTSLPSRLDVPIPFLFRAGAKMLLDLNSILIAFSSILNHLDFDALDGGAKGIRFEEDVRRYVVRACPGVEPVSALEIEFFQGDRVFGEADVVLRSGDTAFLVECKSRRMRGIDDCATYEHAMKRRRKVLEWARQARALARFLAENPVAPRHRAPAEIRWIVPIVCTPAVELCWEDDVELYLVPDELAITMTPEEIVEFVRSERWKDRAQVWQVEVERPGVPLVSRRPAEGRYVGAPDAVHEHYEYLLKRAMRSMYEGRLDDAHEELRLAEAAVPRTPEGRRSIAAELHNLALKLSEAGRSDDAIALYERAIEVLPDYPRGLYGLAVERGRRDEWEKAAQLYRRVVALDDTDFRSWSNLGGALARLRRTDEAMTSCLRALALQPDDTVTLRNLAALYTGEGWIPKAAELYRQAYDLLRRSLGDRHPEVLDVLRRYEEVAKLTGRESAIAGDGRKRPPPLPKR